MITLTMKGILESLENSKKRDKNRDNTVSMKIPSRNAVRKLLSS